MNDSKAHELVRALRVEPGLTCLTGAGGKKSCIYALAQVLLGRVALTSTSHMYAYDEAVVGRVVTIEDAGADITSALEPATERVVAFAGATDTPKRVGGLSMAQVGALVGSATFDHVLVKADGARARLIKAPADYEPLIPAQTGLVIPVVSARVLGRTLDSGIAHRPDRAASVMQTTTTATLTPEHLARLLSAPEGALKGVGQAQVTPLINMVDDAALAAGARAAARAALALTARFDRVVLARLNAREVVEVVTR